MTARKEAGRKSNLAVTKAFDETNTSGKDNRYVQGVQGLQMFCQQTCKPSRFLNNGDWNYVCPDL
eukprot:4885221-Pyramimonas_sp.AAC.2